MAALTWRNVDAPDFRGAMDGYRMAADQLGNAIKSAQTGLAQYKEQGQDTADQRLLAEAMKFSDPAKLQEQLAGADLSGASVRGLGQLGSQVGNLIQQAATTQRTGANQYALDRTKMEDTNLDGAREGISQLFRAYQSDDPKQIQAATEKYGPALSQLAPDIQQGLMKDFQSSRGAEINQSGNRFGNAVIRRNDADLQAGLAAGQNVERSSLTGADARGGLESVADGLSPGALQAAKGTLNPTFGNLYTPLDVQPAAAPGGKGGKPGTQQGSPYDATFNFTPTSQPVSSMPIRDVLQVQEGLKGSQGHSPVGAFQINKATLQDYGPKVLGEDWQDKELTPDNQEALAKAIFEDRKGRDLTKTWSSLPNNSPGAYKDMDWKEMRQILARGEVASNLPEDDPAAIAAAGRDVANQISSRISQDQNSGITADIPRTNLDTSSAASVAQRMVGKDSAFEGADKDLIMGQVRSIMNDYNLTAPEAQAVMERSATKGRWWKPDTTALGSGQGIQDSLIASMAKEVKSGRAQNSATDVGEKQVDQKQLANAEQASKDAAAALVQARLRQASQPKASIQGFEDKAEAAQEKYLKMLERAAKNPRLNRYAG